MHFVGLKGKSISEKNSLAGKRWRSLSQEDKIQYQVLDTSSVEYKSDHEFHRILRNLKESVSNTYNNIFMLS